MINGFRISPPLWSWALLLGLPWQKPSVPAQEGSNLSSWSVLSNSRDLSESQMRCLGTRDNVLLEQVGNDVRITKRLEEQSVLDIPERLRALLSHRQAHYASALEHFEGGTLVGTDAGEWGGELVWIPGDARTAADVTVFAGMPVVGLVRLPLGLFAIRGLAHLSFDSGGIYRVEQQQGGLALTLVARLEERPRAFVTSRGHITLLTGDGIFEFDGRRLGRIQELSLGPLPVRALIETTDRKIVAAVGAYVLKVERSKKSSRLTWLAPPGCAVHGRLVCGCGEEFQPYGIPLPEPSPQATVRPDPIGAEAGR